MEKASSCSLPDDRIGQLTMRNLDITESHCKTDELRETGLLTASTSTGLPQVEHK